MENNQIYWEYFKLDETAYRDKVRLYEEHTTEISTLFFEEKLEIEVDYLFCLFEIGRYDRYLSKVDTMIETVIMENIYQIQGIDIFKELLFRKAACYYQLKQYKKANDILKQLISMDASNPYYMGLYTICLRKTHNDISLSIKAMAVACFMIVLGITLARILIEPFFAYYFEPFIILRTALFFSAILLLVGLESFFQFQIYKETGMFSYQILNNIFGI